ncbi:MAG TPA: nucleotidyltransferase domain-containing protein, partial [Nitrososphaera sp.]
MSSISPQELQVTRECISKVAKRRAVAAVCIYGSQVAGYARPGSDIDILAVLENYPYVVKYAYFTKRGTKVSVLAVDKKALERDAKTGFLGEFVVGRLLHIYEPLDNAEFLAAIERMYKRRVILEEVQDVVSSAGVLSTEINFPLEFVVFSKIKHRMSLYPSAAYSYQKTYSNNNDTVNNERNLEFALDGYRKALSDIIAEDNSLFVARDDGLLQISDKRVLVEESRTSLKLTKRLQEFSSYFVHTYAGRKIMHLAIAEAESKIRRRAKSANLPEFMARPRSAYWQLPEGKLVVDGRDWLGDLGYSVVGKKRLGNFNSRTVLYELQDGHRVVVKEFAKTKAAKWAALSIWTSPVKRRFRVNQLFRLGFEYKAIRHIRGLGLQTPRIEAVVLDRKLLVTQFIEGMTLAEAIKAYLRGKEEKDLRLLLNQAGELIGKIHKSGGTFGNVKPKNVIANSGSGDLYFTDVEQFVFQ